LTRPYQVYISHTTAPFLCFWSANALPPSEYAEKARFVQNISPAKENIE